MRALSNALAVHCAQETTTLCHCWRVIRADGRVMGFTDHDTDLSFAGTNFAAQAGMESTQLTARLGFAVSSSDVIGALESDLISESDIEKGFYDNARIEIWQVNWMDVAQRVLLELVTIGEIERKDYGFSAEVRSLAHLFDQERGRLCQTTCSADLGDVCCGIDPSLPQYRRESEVKQTNGRDWITANLGDWTEDWFSGGMLMFLSGANQGQHCPIKRHDTNGETHELILWTPAAEKIVPGDRFAVTAGCDKTAHTCHQKFDNILNFRGFSLMPGNDVLQAYPNKTMQMDGGSLFQ